jgi:hypothetical protein
MRLNNIQEIATVISFLEITALYTWEMLWKGMQILILHKIHLKINTFIY